MTKKPRRIFNEELLMETLKRDGATLVGTVEELGQLNRDSITWPSSSREA
jgi:hypothetical protein